MLHERFGAILTRTRGGGFGKLEPVPLNLPRWQDSVRGTAGDSMVGQMNAAGHDTGDDDASDYRLIASAEDAFAFGKPQAAAEVRPAEPEAVRPAEAVAAKPYHITTEVRLESPRPPALSEPRVFRKELKTEAELAEMIRLDLSRHPDCPKNGFRVTVYGATHWRAMLTITTAAGGVRNPEQWRDLTDELADRLRQRYDLAWT